MKGNLDMKKQIMSYVGTNKIVSIHPCSDQTSTFYVGKLLYCNEDFYVLAQVSSNGKYDGIELRQTKNVILITSDGRYENKIETLAKVNNSKIAFVHLDSSDLVKSLLQYAQNNHLVVSIELLNSDQFDVQGYVEYVGDGICKVRQISNFGEKDGESISCLNDITIISCDTEDEVALGQLYKDNYQ